MLNHYLAMGLPPNATEEAIRRRYLELVRLYPPSRSPQRFQRINAAYDVLKDRRSRIHDRIYGYQKFHDLGDALDAFTESARKDRAMPGLRDLLALEGKLNEQIEK